MNIGDRVRVKQVPSYVFGAEKLRLCTGTIFRVLQPHYLYEVYLDNMGVYWFYKTELELISQENKHTRCVFCDAITPHLITHPCNHEEYICCECKVLGKCKRCDDIGF